MILLTVILSIKNKLIPLTLLVAFVISILFHGPNYRCKAESSYRMALLPVVDFVADLCAPRFGEAGRARIGGRHVAPRACEREPPADGALDDDRRAPALEILARAAREQLALAIAAEAGLDAASGALQLALNCLRRDIIKSPMNAWLSWKR